jgi:hypothetical protein
MGLGVRPSAIVFLDTWKETEENTEHAIQILVGHVQHL